MTLLAPFFLLGLGAVVVPILVHLVHRQKKESIPFPSLMFLEQIPFKDARRQQLRHKFLFALRCLALLLLALAFARPLLKGSAEAAALEAGGREVVILLDRSHSMRYGDRWDRGVAQARARFDDLGPNDRASLILFDERAEAVSQPTGDVVELNAALAAARPTAGGTRFGPALQLAGRILAESDMPEREAVLITDFQRAGWDGVSDIRLPAGTVVTPVNLGADGASNISVAFVALDQEVSAGNERVGVSARVVNGGPDAVRGLAVTLSLNGQRVQRRSVDIDPYSSAAVTFSPVLIPQGISRGTVTAGTDDLPQDNEYHFVLTPRSTLSALIVESSNPRENQSLFLSRALSIGDNPAFRVDVRPLSALRLSDLADRSIVVFNDAPFPGGRAGQAIREFVMAGGGLLIALGERTGPGTWPQQAADLLPGRVGERVDPARGPIALTTLEYGSPIFELFSAPRSGDFSAAKFLRYARLTVSDPAAVLARYSDGAVALAEKAVGTGKVLVWTSTLDTYWNDLALQPVFLPFIHRVARYLSGYQETRSAFVVGDVLELTEQSPDPAVRALVAAGGDLVVEAPSGGRRLLREEDGGQVVELTEQGFFEIRQADGADVPPALVAANLDPVESDLATLDTDQFLGAVAPLDMARGVTEGSQALTSEDMERRQQLWWYVLMAALVILLGETVLSNRLSRAVR